MNTISAELNLVMYFVLMNVLQKSAHFKTQTKMSWLINETIRAAPCPDSAFLK